jgi:hypothetical protein
VKKLFENWRKHLNEATDIDISVDPPVITTVDTPEPSGVGGSPTKLAFFILARAGSSATMQDGKSYKAGYKSKLERMVEPNTKLTADQIPAGAYVMVNFGNDEQRRYDKNTGPEGEEF